MARIIKQKVATGVYWIEIPEADLRVLCGTPSDSVKHLLKKRLIRRVEHNGSHFESGPNAILLSDALLQHSRFSNLSEFPVLQMLYGQGMLIPNHPNTGRKPLLIGSADQVRAQLQYIYHGNYGLTSLQEIIDCGIAPELADEMMAVKLRFAFGTIHPSKDFLDTRIVGEGEVELRKGVHLQRIGFNRFRFRYGRKSATVDLNLKPRETYDTPYRLGFPRIKRAHFSVIHSGEGDGWDVRRPCMASIISFRGRIYLIDAGPNLRHTLCSLGIDANEIEGIFHTHSHDDHFAGLPTLMRRDRPLKHYTTPLVRASVARKFAALLDCEEGEFTRYFEPHDLIHDQWNDIDGLEVMPVFSPHPVETNMFRFRAPQGDGYRSYAHLADTTSLEVLGNMIGGNGEIPGISREYYERVKRDYLEPATVKKVDIGGGMIHGNAEDFRGDTSERLLLAHSAAPLSREQREIGGQARFGASDVLIADGGDPLRERAERLLRQAFPGAPEEALRALLHHPLVEVEPGAMLLRRGRKARELQLVVTGWVEWLRTGEGLNFTLSSGNRIGELALLRDTPSNGSYRALSRLHVLKIPAEHYRRFAARQGIAPTESDTRRLLRHSWLFGESLNDHLREALAEKAESRELPGGECLAKGKAARIVLVSKGELELIIDGARAATLTVRDALSEARLPRGAQLRARKNSRLLLLPAAEVERIPAVQWKLLELHAHWRG